MPAREKGRQRTAGLFVLIGLLLLGVLIVEFGRFGDRFSGHYPLYIEFPDTAGIIKNSEVRMRGAKIGRVATQPELIFSGGATSTVKMEMRIRDGVKIPRDSTFKIGSSGLLGDKFIDITPPDHKTGDYYESGDNIIGVGAGGIDAIKSNAEDIARDASQLIKDAKKTFAKIDEALDSIKKIGDSVDVTMTKVNNEFLSKENLGNFNKAIANFEEGSRELKPTVTETRETMASIKKAADGAQTLIAEAREEIKGIKPALAEVPQAVRNISRAASSAEKTLTAMQNKKGLVGTLAYDQETGTNAKEFMRNLKRYGILRYRDKSTADERDPRNKFRGSRR